MLRRLTSPRGLIYLFSLLIALNLSVEFAQWRSRDGLFLADGELPVGRDFAVFYAAGRIVGQGDGADLYDLDRQTREMDRTLGRAGFFLPFAYPAFVALPYVLIGEFPYLLAYALATCAMFGALALAILILRRGSATARDHPALVIAALLAFSPVTWATFGGLNGAFSLLCLSGAYVALLRGKQNRAGGWLGLLMFKPQLAGPLLLLLLWRRQWRTVGFAALVGVVLAILAAAATSPTWILDFLALTGNERYLAPERQCCGMWQLSLPGALSWWLNGTGWTMLLITTVVGAVAVAATVAAWRDTKPTASSFPLHFGLALAVTLLLSPHSLFYESMLLVIPVLALLDHWRFGDAANAETGAVLGDRHRLLVVGLFVVGSLWPLARHLGVQPAIVLPVAIAVLCCRAMGREYWTSAQQMLRVRGPRPTKRVAANQRPVADLP